MAEHIRTPVHTGNTRRYSCLYFDSNILVLMSENVYLDEEVSLFPVKSPELSALKVQKRAPSTPLTPSTAQQNITRRKLAAKPAKYLEFESPLVLECKYENWMLEQQLRYSKEIVAFMEMERKFARGE